MDDNKQKDAASLVDGWLEEIMKKMESPENSAPAAESGEEAVETPEVSAAASQEEVPSDEPVEEAPVEEPSPAPSVEETIPNAEDIAIPMQNNSPTIFFERPDASALTVNAPNEQAEQEAVSAVDIPVQAEVPEEGASALDGEQAAETISADEESSADEATTEESPSGAAAAAVASALMAAGAFSAPEETAQDDFIFPVLNQTAASQEPHPLDDPTIQELLAGETTSDQEPHPLDDPLIQELLADSELSDQENISEEAAAQEDTPEQESISGVPILSDQELYAPSEDAAQNEQETAAEPAEETKKDKLRPKWKKGYGLFGLPHIASTFIWLALILAIGVSLGRTVWLCAADLLALGKTGKAVSITIDKDDEMTDIAIKLKDAGLIEYPKLFEKFVQITGKGDQLLVGTIDFSAEMVYDYNALINALSFRGVARVTVEVMIPEGYNCAQIFELLEEKGVCTARSLEKYAAEGELEKYWFLDGVERGHKYCLEGFLFPDTYEFYIGDEPERVIHKLLDGFDYRFSSRMVDKFVALNQKTGLKLTLRDVITMASIVEKEKAGDLEGYDIASVFYNRLKNPGSYPLLQSDATIKYDVDFRSKGELITDAQINASPYNTYTKKGLPPGPIANPGLSSLDAALDPNDTSYYFFIFDKNAGVHRFSKTLSEHNAWAKKLGLS